MPRAGVVRYIVMQKYDPKPSCSRCLEKAIFEVLLEMNDHYLMHRFCDACLVEAGYELPS